MSPETRAAIRAAISNAYYDARNEGRTMEDAADRATAAVIDIVEPPEVTIGGVHL